LPHRRCWTWSGAKSDLGYREHVQYWGVVS